MFTTFTLVGLMAMAQTSPRLPTSMQTGNDVLATCESPNDPAFRDGLICMAWVSGVTQGLEAARRITGVCLANLPPSATNAQYRDIIVRFLRDNPVYRHQLAGPQAAAALSRAYPCPDSN